MCQWRFWRGQLTATFHFSWVRYAIKTHTNIELINPLRLVNVQVLSTDCTKHFQKMHHDLTTRDYVFHQPKNKTITTGVHRWQRNSNLFTCQTATGISEILQLLPYLVSDICSCSRA